MSALFVILPVALLIAACAVAAFYFATQQGQFDDLDSPAHRAIYSDETPQPAPQPTPPEPAKTATFPSSD